MLSEVDFCDYETCIVLRELGYNQPSIAFYPCQDIIVDCIDSNGELYEAEYDKGNLALYSSLNNKNHDINKVQAPLLYESQKWLMEEKMIGVFVSGFKNGYTFWVNNLLNGDTLYQGFFDNETGKKYKSYEEALAEGIKEAVKILKNLMSLSPSSRG